LYVVITYKWKGKNKIAVYRTLFLSIYYGRPDILDIACKIKIDQT